MAAASNQNCDAKIQNQVKSIEQDLQRIFSEQGNEDGKLYFSKISKKTGKGNIYSIYSSMRKPLKNGIYLITLNLPGRSSHGVVLFISQDINGQPMFHLFEPNGRNWANNPSFYEIEINVNGNIQDINTSLSPTSNVNGSGNCGIWGIVVSILLNSLMHQEITEEEKDNFFRFLNENNTNGIRFITYISNTYFNTERQFNVNLFREAIINMIKNPDSFIGGAHGKGGKKIKTKKKKGKSIKKARKGKKGKKRKKTKKY